jgi:hypothetical protein
MIQLEGAMSDKEFTVTIKPGLDKNPLSRHIHVEGEDEEYIAKLKAEKKERDKKG